MVLSKNFYIHPLISDADYEKIASSHIRVIFKKGDLLLWKGQTAKKYYCIESGIIRSFVISSEGNDVTTGFITEGEIAIDVASIFLNIPTKENFEAVTDCVCWRIDFDRFQELFFSIQGFTEWGRNWMSHELFETKKRSLSIITDSATDRYLNFIKEKPEIIQNVPLKLIASYLGITDTSLSRIRKEIGRR